MTQKGKMSVGQQIGYRMLLWLCLAVGMLPSWFLYHCLADVIYFFIYKVFKYRVRVVRGNLGAAFPEKNEAERRQIERRFYRHLSEVMIDTVDLAGITHAQVRKRFVIENLEQHELSVGGANWIAALAHYGSWEYFTSYPLHTSSHTASAYHPLHNLVMDKLMLRTRSRFGMQLVPMYDFGRFVARNSNRDDSNFALGMIMDQSPNPQSSYVWLKFLGQPTRFFSSMEKFAVKYNLKVYFFHTEKPARAHYRTRIEMIYDGREFVSEGEIVARYAARLEEQIRHRPELWMWSHRRWKRPAPPEIMEMFAAGCEIVSSDAEKK